MSSYDEFTMENDRVELTLNAGKCLARLDGKKVYEGKYVVGDMEDKLAENVRAFKKIAEILLAEQEQLYEKIKELKDEAARKADQLDLMTQELNKLPKAKVGGSDAK